MKNVFNLLRTIYPAGYVLFILLSYSLQTYAFTFTAETKDQSGAPAIDTAVYLQPVNTQAPLSQNATASIDQINRTFVPLVSIIQTGTSVSFPNKDNIRHHVYSFSPSKTFQLKLYSGIPANPITFEKSGLVTIGCNIHDGMVAYVVIADTPWFAKSDNSGIARIENLPAGEYILYAWHYQQKDLAIQKIGTIKLDADKTTAISFELKTKAGK